MERGEMNREYHKWYSSHLQKDMELLVFGHAGKPILFFPTRTARFYDYENWGVMETMRSRIESGELHFFCVDSVDRDSFYCKTIEPAERIQKHYRFEKYILNEVLPFIKKKNNYASLIVAGCSLGAFHAVNIAMRFPQFFKKVIGMSGRYDLTLKLKYFNDLFDGYRDTDIYRNTPVQYINDIVSEQLLRQLRKLDVSIAIGKEDAFIENNILLGEALTKKNIPHVLEFWEGEAHKAVDWGQMLQRYL